MGFTLCKIGVNALPIGLARVLDIFIGNINFQEAQGQLQGNGSIIYENSAGTSDMYAHIYLPHTLIGGAVNDPLGNYYFADIGYVFY